MVLYHIQYFLLFICKFRVLYPHRVSALSMPYLSIINFRFCIIDVGFTFTPFLFPLKCVKAEWTHERQPVIKKQYIHIPTAILF